MPSSCDRLSPVATVQSPVLDGFSEVRDGQVLGTFEVGNGAGNFEDAIVGAGGKALLLHGAFEQALGVGAEFAVDANLPRVHLGIRVDFLASLVKALALAFAGGHDAGANLSRALSGRVAAKFFVLHGWNFDVNVDAIE